MDDFLSNFVLKKDEKQLSDSKKDILKFLKQIGVDTRFVSYFDDKDVIKLYIIIYYFLPKYFYTIFTNKKVSIN